ncbi:ABC transporter ATP-binding protein [Rhodospirillum rubrum]|uniref:ABC transporter component n=1 Tax=Rhodospirillum rubrum (strain ATCC 11170 / ATH 1.1.1 / DSM 467 / LMG 4362 / NCIMB 8255 / S1) TaxID=269796 RepID=Q2RNP8_RHORT|nr:ABC transporter component [Rhodospirillum rubrum ATCC 11170]MBK5955965.1 sulfonate ABC transporter ATP-binding protein [Rhodospirillum rubrum]HAQ00019.1 ABC transporter ATP-binding protein [Rhodospirillum rubrum]HCF16613.1 ABC transporter ATP-binding protein [Rhodospirillum rubrum]
MTPHNPFRHPEPVAGSRPHMVRADGLCLSYSGTDAPVHALKDVDLTIEAGDFVSLIGPSGCGKTTLLRVIADLEQPTGGSITVEGVSPHEARERRLYGYVFQAPALFPWRTVLRNVTLPLEIIGLPKDEREARARDNLARVGLTGFEGKFPFQLSGGMRQRVSIARALALAPDLLLMDEPFGALDEITRHDLNQQLTDLWRETGKTCVFVTHSISEAIFLSTKVIVMTPRPGRVIDVVDCSGLPRVRTAALRDAPEFRALAARVRLGLREGHDGH